MTSNIYASNLLLKSLKMLSTFFELLLVPSATQLFSLMVNRLIVYSYSPTKNIYLVILFLMEFHQFIKYLLSGYDKAMIQQIQHMITSLLFELRSPLVKLKPLGPGLYSSYPFLLHL